MCIILIISFFLNKKEMKPEEVLLICLPLSRKYYSTRTVKPTESKVLTGKWNTFANSVVGKLAGFNPVNVDLDDYLTNRALDGMFLKVQDEEKKIRTNVSARVTPLLERVFGSLD
jgi:hypothetical protein